MQTATKTKTRFVVTLAYEPREGMSTEDSLAEIAKLEAIGTSDWEDDSFLGSITLEGINRSGWIDPTDA